jgi:TonB family protein
MKAEATPGWMTLGVATLFALSLISCVSSSAPHPRGPIDSAAAKREWSSQVRAQIRNYWNPWDVVRTLKPTAPPWRATTVLRIAVQGDGAAAPPEIVGSSGSAALDNEATRAVAAALPLPTPPPELSNGGSSVALVLGFRVVSNEDPKVPPVDDEHDPFGVIVASCESPRPGVVDPLEVRRTVETYRRDLVMCADRQHAADLEAIGEVTIEFVIAESGRVSHPIVLKTRGLTRALEGCLVNAMSLWTFRKPTGGPVKMVFPFRFGAGQAAGADLTVSPGIGVRHPQR